MATDEAAKADSSTRGDGAGERIVLRARSVMKTFVTTDPPTPVLRGIDLDVPGGEFLVIMGASGSGKSTLLYALSGLDRPTSGSVALGGHDLTAMSEKEASRLRLQSHGLRLPAELLPRQPLHQRQRPPARTQGSRDQGPQRLRPHRHPAGEVRDQPYRRPRNHRGLRRSAAAGIDLPRPVGGADGGLRR